MKLHFESNLDYQAKAIDSVCNLFRGQEVCRSEFTVTLTNQLDENSDLVTNDFSQIALGIGETDLGIGNRFTIGEGELLENLKEVQFGNVLPPSTTLGTKDFTIEMETGTGKTYVYIRTIFELNKRYGFSKFVVVVPSVAIKEGVYKTLEITSDHFKGLYSGVPFEYFIYDSSKLDQVRNFATSASIQIMVVTVGAINKKDVNNLYKDSEKTGGEKPIDLIKATSPIVIVDEPQSVDGGLSGAGKTALDAMNPLCTLRYSATHIDKHNMVYKLDAVDAYERKLVKQIEVASATIEDGFNKPYVRIVSTNNKKGTISAIAEMDIATATGVKRQEVTVYDGDNLEQITKRPIYQDYRIGEINTSKGKEFVELRFPNGEEFLKINDTHGGVDKTALQREMIRRTIKEHIEKEIRLSPQGIKVLSLFFVDNVSKYRNYLNDGTAEKGIYAKMFEEEFARAIKLPEFKEFYAKAGISSDPELIHNGYFSIDKKGGWTDTDESNNSSRDNAERAYNLIMKDKETLLSLETPLRFIFSHSALKEGWDNPNVFQICALREMGTERDRRQTIGRGLRLCVNQAGERIRGFEVNTLTVIAAENYEEFAENLQREIETDSGVRFGVVERDQFAAMPVHVNGGRAKPFGTENSNEVWEFLKSVGYIDSKGMIEDTLRIALKTDTLNLPSNFKDQSEGVVETLRKIAGRLDIKNADERITIKTREKVFNSEEFKELWNRIKHKTTYRVQFDNAKFTEDCIRALINAPAITKTRLEWRKADLEIEKSGVTSHQTGTTSTVILNESNIELPDLVTELQDRTRLTRKTIVKILVESGRLDDFKKNPQQFIEFSSQLINKTKRLALVDGIKYQKVGSSNYYAQELFEQEELTGYLKNILNETNKSVYEQVVYDSITERDFARDLEKNESIKVYAKLPSWFKVPTPLGSYNPDWAVLIEHDDSERLYFVVETKGTLFAGDIRESEYAKIQCGKEHFKALEENSDSAQFMTAVSADDFLARVVS